MTSQADAGRGAIDFAARHMPALRAAAEKLHGGALIGRTVGVALMLEPKTAAFVEALATAGARPVVLGNAFSTKPAVVDALRAGGIEVIVAGERDDDGVQSDGDLDRDENRQRDAAFDALLDAGIELLADDGAVVTRYAHRHRPDVFGRLVGVAEETTSGVRPLRKMQHEGVLRVACLAVDDARAKREFDNVYGTGHSVVMAVLDVTNVQMPGTRVVVVGYGQVGRGIAHTARALGALVTVTEIDPIAALRAHHDGFLVATRDRALTTAEIVITATGFGQTLTGDDLNHLGRGTIVAVGGAGRWEIDWRIGADVQLGDEVRPQVRALRLADGREAFLVADGHCANTTAGEGNPIEIMDLSLALQLRALGLLAEGGYDVGVHRLPESVEHEVAGDQLLAMGQRLDSPGEAQRQAAQRW